MKRNTKGFPFDLPSLPHDGRKLGARHLWVPDLPMALPSVRNDEDVCSMFLVSFNDADSKSEVSIEGFHLSPRSMGGEVCGQGGCKRKVSEDEATLA